MKIEYRRLNDGSKITIKNTTSSEKLTLPNLKCL